MTKAARDTNAAARRETIDGVDHPASFPSMSAQIRRASPALNARVPRTSSRFALGSRDSPMYFRVPTIRVAEAGTFTRNTHLHPTKFVIIPPTIGPTARAMPRLAPQKAKAGLRSAPVKAFDRIAREAVSRKAPPTPWAARARFSMNGVVATPQAADEMAKT